jgi:Asp/Glu/hydantoin racemase
MNWKQLISTATEDWIRFVNDQLDLIGVNQNHHKVKTQKAYVISDEEDEKRLSNKERICK